MLDQERISELFEKYLNIIRLEVNEFGCKPTEVRHLIGRLGEFYAAIYTQGQLSHIANQHGFDVISRSGNKISVKTTAQKSGFVSINPNTIDKVDDLMLLQYKNEELEVIFYGPIGKAVEVSRTWQGKYEFDISKAKRLT